MQTLSKTGGYFGDLGSTYPRPPPQKKTYLSNPPPSPLSLSTPGGGCLYTLEGATFVLWTSIMFTVKHTLCIFYLQLKLNTLLSSYTPKFCYGCHKIENDMISFIEVFSTVQRLEMSFFESNNIYTPHNLKPLFVRVVFSMLPPCSRASQMFKLKFLPRELVTIVR